VNKQSYKKNHTQYALNNSKNQEISKSDYYTNLMLIAVVQAMVLLIGQLLIYNGFAIPTLTGAMWSKVVPAILIISLITAAISVLFIFAGKKKMLWSLFSFSVYTSILMSAIRYIPNEWSKVLEKPIVNAARGQKIGVILSVLYIIGLFAYYSFLASRAHKPRKKDRG